MHLSEPLKAAASTHPLEFLVELIRRARVAESPVALRFVAVNDSHLLAPFQQSALWFEGRGVAALSGLVEVEANVPYVRWVSRVCTTLTRLTARALTAADLPVELAAEWEQWIPAHALWIPLGRGAGHDVGPSGGLLFARDLPWRDLDVRLFVEWIETWGCIYRLRTKRTALWLNGQSLIRRIATRRLPWAIGLLAALFIPVRLSVLAPGELVPAHPVAIRAPLDGVIKTFHLQTNDRVETGQPLFSYDDAALASRLDVALEALRTAEAEQRQFGQQAFTDQKARAALSAARGNVEERRLEVDFLRSQLERSKVLSPQAGVVFVDDPSEWIGRSVAAGERIMRLAEPDDQEIEAWLPVADAIILPKSAPVRLYLSSSPMAPASGHVRYESFDAFRRPDGHYAYRIRATLDGPSRHRVGLRGTVRLAGNRVPLIYWIVRRPLAALREFVGI